MEPLNENTLTWIEGHIRILDVDSGKEIVNKRNAINLENMVMALSSSLSGTANGYDIQSIAFGSGGIAVDTVGNILYNPTNTATTTGSLYNETFSKSVAFSPEINVDNNISFVHNPGTFFSDIVIRCTLNYNEPNDQDLLDTGDSVNGDYVFNELGIKTQNGLFLTHVIFHPVQKSANRKIQVIYTVRLSASS